MLRVGSIVAQGPGPGQVFGAGGADGEELLGAAEGALAEALGTGLGENLRGGNGAIGEDLAEELDGIIALGGDAAALAGSWKRRALVDTDFRRAKPLDATIERAMEGQWCGRDGDIASDDLQHLAPAAGGGVVWLRVVGLVGNHQDTAGQRHERGCP